MVIYLLIIFLCLVTFHLYTRLNRSGRILSKIPGPTAFPLIGNLLQYRMACPHELWKISRKHFDLYYPVMRIWSAASAVICIRHPDDAEILLTSQKVIDKGFIYTYLHPWLKTGLLTSTGDKWRHRRKLLTPAFHFNVLKTYMDIIIEESQKCIEDLKSKGDETEISLVPFSSRYTLNVICESAMGVALDKMASNTIDAYKKAIYKFGSIIIYRLCRPYIYDWMMIPIWRLGRMQRDNVKILHEFSNTVVQNRKAYHNSTENKYLKEFEDLEHSDLYLGKRKRLAMLDLLLSAEQKGLIDEEGIKEEVDTFTFEGHDTTAMALTFTLLLLAEHKEAQDRVRAEVTDVIDRSGKKLSLTDLQELSYLERCLKESLRLFPSVSGIVRATTEDLQLKNVLVPGGVHVIFNIFDLHRDPNFWPDPEKFDPDRFLPENNNKRHPFAYVPFSAGPRNCIGQKFAMMELKSIIAHILYDYYLEPIDTVATAKLTLDLVIRPLNPVFIKFIKIRN